MANRPTWDEYFMEIARTVSTRGTCDRGRSGCVIVRDKRILTTGYVGSPPGMPHCDEAGHQMAEFLDEAGSRSQHCIRTIHAEQNAIAQAARFGISLVGGTLYCKMEPCYVCARLIISVGITRVVAEKRYQRGEMTREMFQQAGIRLDVLNDEVERYSNKE
ncbi:cell division protein DedD [Candidatus Uhrbacteria bacterium RIFCSPHIGHO2_12_FULL_54_23]|uniref:Cell division protein DedD n=1 Tax=Candidatus Uhrbacteria bacterium RIFCSPHIGHO2_12_FULL_54_23 TaxID=1802397 RepID=A0A1F7UK23_9BACT|nr:MAG: cell division protein DedD [Candidatus Rokubacteria bacterium GWC2_70_16]OGL78074.1 MAG: cell division protein DedD [Candidatus Uhrbacteria bacterium RIFCSPHIGHO2_12_FULL_54_23]